MSHESSEQLIEALSRDLAPVRPSPRLRTSLGLMGLVVLASLAALALSHPPRLDVLAAITHSALYDGVLVGLALAALGATAAALAAGLPGREGVMKLGSSAALVGIVVATGSCVLSIQGSGVGRSASIGDDLLCFFRVFLFGIAPTIVLVRLQLRGWLRERLDAAALGLVGATGMSALIVHLYCCPIIDGRHFLVGHAGAAVIISMAGSLPLRALLRRRLV